MTQTKTAHFTMTGADFTNIARQRLLEDNPGHAWRIASCLIGEDEKDNVAGVALDILRGTKKLIGDESRLQLVDEDPEVTKAYQEQVDELYAGRFRYKDRWYRPVARVIDFGIRDLNNDHGVVVRRIGVLSGGQTGYSNRQWHYAFRDEIAPPTENDDVIFAPCSERPHWQEIPRTTDDAVAQYLKHGWSLEKRGHSLWYPGKSGDDLEAREYPNGRNGRRRKLHPDTLTEEAEERLTDKHLRAPRGDDTSGDDDEAKLEAALLLHAANQIAEAELRGKVVEPDDDEEYRVQEARRVAHVAELREKILQQANGDLIELSWKATENGRYEAGSVKVPRPPFLRWLWGRHSFFVGKLPSWEPVSPMGMKMNGDDRFHTDWVIGAGFDPEDRRMTYHPSPVVEAAYELSATLRDEYAFSGDHRMHVIVEGFTVEGVIVHGKPNTAVPAGAVVVLPNLHPRYLKATIDAAAVITQAGGETAHLAQVGRERALPMVRWVTALRDFEPGAKVYLNSREGTLIKL